MAACRRRDYVTLGKRFLHRRRRRIIFPARTMASQVQSLIRFAFVLAIFSAWTRPAMADQQPRPFSFQVSKNDSAKAEALADQLAALSLPVNREGARLLAQVGYSTGSKLRRQYRMF